MSGRALAAIALVHVVAAGAVEAQRIPRDEYLRNIPLRYPTLVRQTAASEEVHLFGDRSDPAYRDSETVDGIDDRRGRVLVDLAVRFAPYLVLNTTAIPMDLRRFMTREESFPLFVDRWDVARDVPALVNSEEIPWQGLAEHECVAPADARRAVVPDCRLLSLLERWDPVAPGPAYRSGAGGAERSGFDVLFFDFPGYDEETWRDEFVNPFSERLPVEYEDYAKVFVHPFVEWADASRGAQGGYRFVLQYWFFYPFNDGAMNHEGDWEHINVFVTPLDELEGPLSANDVERILRGNGLDDVAPDRLVVQKVDYYFHHFVMTLDYTRPNVYLPRAEWEAEVARLTPERRGERWLWRQVRYYAYRDQAEAEINTHPIGFIGADNKGNDQLLKAPGGSNRDSHGTYPFPAYYKDVGPGGAAERIEQRFDHRAYFASGAHEAPVPTGGYGRGSVVGLASPERVEIVPDGERVVDLVKVDARARREWAWLVLPVRWGYPATASPFSWLVPHTDLGNSAVVGPSYNGGWNRSGDASGYEAYVPHRFGSLFALSWQDGFANDLGYLNFVVPTIGVLPPFDLVWRLVAAPFRQLLGTQDPILQTSEHVPYRVMALAPEAAHVRMSEDFVHLIKNEDQVELVGARLASAIMQADSVIGAERSFVDDATMTGGLISLHLGERLSSENALRHSRTTMGVDIALPTIAEVFSLRGDLNFWEYSGSLRYNLSGGRFMPFVKGGYGLSWYRVENVSTNGVPLEVPHGPWINRPSLKHPSTLLPNTWHAGVGIEWVPLRSYASFPRGVDFGIRAGAIVYRHDLGLDIEAVVPTSSGFNIGAGRASSPVITRTVYDVAFTISF